MTAETPGQDVFVGIDVGGTFTDCVALSPDGSTVVTKVLTTPGDESVGVANGLAELAAAQKIDTEEYLRRIRRIVHGTTVATNAVVTGAGARTGLLTTSGFRDALQMRLGTKEEQYDNRYQGPQPLVPRTRRIGVTERVDKHGRVLIEADEAEIVAAIKALQREGVEAIAVCFLHSYANAENEQRAGRRVTEQAPGLYLTLSSTLLPQIRFYERLSTTVFNAYLGPIVAGYFHRLVEGFERLRFGGQLLIMQSNGGVVSPEAAVVQAAGAINSGPAAGPIAGAAHAEILGYRDCITVDMGGTSFDVSMVSGGKPLVVPDAEFDRRVLALTTIDTKAIGAGGGSIGWIDAGGLLRMGPASAGAKPGPACYGFGGEQPTCTDADLVLGYLNPDFFLGGRLRLQPNAAVEAIERQIAEPLGLDLEAAAAGMYRVINVNMAAGVRSVSVNKGVDPRDVPLVVAGGAGPVHAGAIAEELGIPVVIVPRLSSVLCAAGMLLTDLQHDYIRTQLVRLNASDPQALVLATEEMIAAGRETLAAAGLSEGQMHFHIALDLRYVGQHREIKIAIAQAEIAASEWQAVAERFHAAHEREYGHRLPFEPLELVNIRVSAQGVPEKLKLPVVKHVVSGIPSPKARRAAYFGEARGFEEVDVYDGSLLTCGHRLSGPAIVEEVSTTVVVPPGYDLLCDPHRSYVLALRDLADDLGTKIIERANGDSGNGPR